MIFRLPKRTQPDIQPDIQPDRPKLPPTAPTRRSSWWFWLALLCQTGLILAVPAQDAYTYATGRPVTLQTAPVDPYDLLRGYSQRLSYEISDTNRLQKLSGGSAVSQSSGEFYLVLEAPASGASNQPPKPWQPVRISPTRPENLAQNQVALQGKTDPYGRISYGLETYYMPEDQRNQINRQISEIGQIQQNQQAFVVEIKVDSAGNAVPISLWVKDQNYRF